MSETVTINGKDYPVDKIVELVPPVQPEPEVGQVWVFPTSPVVLYEVAPGWLEGVCLDGSGNSGLHPDHAIYAAPSVEEYYRQQQPDELTRAEAAAFGAIRVFVTDGLGASIRKRRFSDVFELEGNSKETSRAWAAELDHMLFGRKGEVGK